MIKKLIRAPDNNNFTDILYYTMFPLSSTPLPIPVFFNPLDARDFVEIKTLESGGQVHPWSDAMIMEELACEHAFHFGARVDEKGGLCAFVLCRRILDEVHIHNLCTLPGMRRQGLATALIKYVLSHARTCGARSGFLEVRSSNTAAIRLYKAQAFTIALIRRSYYSNGDDALVMSRPV
jgi:ribosomal-protein-alanine N-acetyltransferase